MFQDLNSRLPQPTKIQAIAAVYISGNSAERSKTSADGNKRSSIIIAYQLLFLCDVIPRPEMKRMKYGQA